MHCSSGLHVGSLSYSGPGGWYNSGDDKIVIVKVNPADAVSVPSDHGASKLRVCKYEVIGEYEKDLDDVYEPSEDLDLYSECDEDCVCEEEEGLDPWDDELDDDWDHVPF